MKMTSETKVRKLRAVEKLGLRTVNGKSMETKAMMVMRKRKRKMK